MKSVFKSLTIRSIIVMLVPQIGVAIANPTPETIGVAIVATIGFIGAATGRWRIGDLHK
jgi:hypothetical protein